MTRTRQKPSRGVLVKEMGFGNYRAYLKSDVWSDIRLQVLERDDWKCVACDQRASQVHHRSYDRETIRGECLDRLISICRGCHYHIEFECGERKRTSKQVEEFLCSLVGIPTVRITPQGSRNPRFSIQERADRKAAKKELQKVRNKSIKITAKRVRAKLKAGDPV